ncbi:MAG: glycerophosphodiester phosphodiesterase family protein [Nakamurella sp.]
MRMAVAQHSSLRRRDSMPIVVAHRGASAHVPENTVQAFEAAWNAGAEWVEADTQPTADGVPVILHDEQLDRTTSGTGPVRAELAAVVSQLEILGLPGARVPAVADVLAALTPQRKVLLEIKGEHTADQVTVLLRTVDGHDEQVELETFEVDVLRTVRAIAQTRPIGLLVDGLDADPVAVSQELGAVAYNPEYREILRRPQVVPQLHAARIAIAAWTCDDPDDWQRLTDSGVDAIITNTPAELLVWQRSRRDLSSH